MTRPTKEGLEYFPLDTDIDQDDKVSVVVAKHGMKGFGIIIRLMMEVYRNGYFYPWTEKEQYVLSMKIGEPIEKVNEIVDECLRWGFFHKETYEQHGILTSKGFQKRYLLATRRRKNIQIKPEYRLIEDNNTSLSEVNDDNNSGSTVDNGGNEDTETSQSKRKEKKVNNSRRKRTYDEDNQYFKMAKYFHERVSGVAEAEGLTHLVIKANMQRWADEFRKLVELDGVNDKRLIRDVMDWVTEDPFWKTNILSAGKLRDKFTELALKMKSSQKAKRQQSQQPDPRDKEIAFQQWIAEGNDPDAFNWDN